jgi:hypothetical protein
MLMVLPAKNLPVLEFRTVLPQSCPFVVSVLLPPRCHIKRSSGRFFSSLMAIYVRITAGILLNMGTVSLVLPSLFVCQIRPKYTNINISQLSPAMPRAIPTRKQTQKMQPLNTSRTCLDISVNVIFQTRPRILESPALEAFF